MPEAGQQKISYVRCGDAAKNVHEQVGWKSKERTNRTPCLNQTVSFVKQGPVTHTQVKSLDSLLAVPGEYKFKAGKNRGTAVRQTQTSKSMTCSSRSAKVLETATRPSVIHSDERRRIRHLRSDTIHLRVGEKVRIKL